VTDQGRSWRARGDRRRPGTSHLADVRRDGTRPLSHPLGRCFPGADPAPFQV